MYAILRQSLEEILADLLSNAHMTGLETVQYRYSQGSIIKGGYSITPSTSGGGKQVPQNGSIFPL